MKEPVRQIDDIHRKSPYDSVVAIVFGLIILATGVFLGITGSEKFGLPWVILFVCVGLCLIGFAAAVNTDIDGLKVKAFEEFSAKFPGVTVRWEFKRKGIDPKYDHYMVFKFDPTVPVRNNFGEERAVFILSETLGIRIRCDSDGIVRVKHVSSEVTDPSIARQGMIEAGDVLREVAGLDLRRPIGNVLWNQIMLTPKTAPRPMVLIVAKENVEEV